MQLPAVDRWAAQHQCQNFVGMQGLPCQHAYRGRKPCMYNRFDASDPAHPSSCRCCRIMYSLQTHSWGGGMSVPMVAQSLAYAL